MSENSLKEHFFKKKDQVTLMTTKKSGSSEVAHIDPALLFQRFIIVAQRSSLKEDYFKFELCTIPPALFERNGFMRKANKPELAKESISHVGLMLSPQDRWELPASS